MCTERLSEIPIEKKWSFADKTIKDTAYITHGYYTYPAKFIPQLASSVINEYSKKGDIVIDPFLGSGTTLVEAIVNGRIGIGTDINEIACLVAKVKTTLIDSDTLHNAFDELMLKMNFYSDAEICTDSNLPERVDYWFKPHIKNKLWVMMNYISSIEDTDIRDFFLVAFAQILKSCSIWLQKSIKPTRDLNKKEIDPLYKFGWQVKRMLKKHKQFNELLGDEVIKNNASYRVVKNTTSKNIPCESEKASLILTSPPYVTSYEYADLHQLPSLWFGFFEELSDFRKKFIGSSFRERDRINIKSKIAYDIVEALGKTKKSTGVANYFADMLESFLEMKRVLRKGGKAAVVIGNTKIKGVDILNAEVFKEQFENIGFKTHKVIHREIPSKMLPSTRDPRNGRFTKATNTKKTLVYPTEYVLIMEKK